MNLEPGKIYKIKKAHWIYECAACLYVKETTPDKFSAREAQQDHEKTLGHLTELVYWRINRMYEAIVDMMASPEKT